MQLPSFLSIVGAFVFLIFALFSRVEAAAPSSQDTQWIQYTDNNGVTVYLDDNREPALYTKDFGDCLGNSVIDVTRWDAAYYKDNMTILFHLGGTTAVANESVMSRRNISRILLKLTRAS